MLNKLAEDRIDLNLSGAGEVAKIQDYTISAIISTAIAIMFLVAGLIFFFMLVWGGLAWVSSGGDKGKTEAARNRITAALIGLVIVFAAWAIVTLIQTVFGIQILNFDVPTIIP